MAQSLRNLQIFRNDGSPIVLGFREIKTQFENSIANNTIEILDGEFVDLRYYKGKYIDISGTYTWHLYYNYQQTEGYCLPQDISNHGGYTSCKVVGLLGLGINIDNNGEVGSGVANAMQWVNDCYEGTTVVSGNASGDIVKVAVTQNPEGNFILTGVFNMNGLSNALSFDTEELTGNDTGKIKYTLIATDSSSVDHEIADFTLDKETFVENGTIIDAMPILVFDNAIFNGSEAQFINIVTNNAMSDRCGRGLYTRNATTDANGNYTYTKVTDPTSYDPTETYYTYMATIPARYNQNYIFTDGSNKYLAFYGVNYYYVSINSQTDFNTHINDGDLIFTYNGSDIETETDNSQFERVYTYASDTDYYIQTDQVTDVYRYNTLFNNDVSIFTDEELVPCIRLDLTVNGVALLNPIFIILPEHHFSDTHVSNMVLNISQNKLTLQRTDGVNVDVNIGSLVGIGNIVGETAVSNTGSFIAVTATTTNHITTLSSEVKTTTVTYDSNNDALSTSANGILTNTCVDTIENYVDNYNCGTFTFVQS